jgi:hypothetical protein
MVYVGSGETLRNGHGKLHCVVPDGVGKWYHVATNQSVEEVASALRARKVNARASRLDELIKQHGNRIWVGLVDSIAGGNCQAGTQAFAKSFAQQLSACGDLGAATAEAILRVRNDSFTLRACRVAALRYESQITQEKEYAHA